MSVTESCRHLLQTKVCLSLELFLLVLIYMKGKPMPGWSDNGKVGDSFSLCSRKKRRITR